MKYLEFGCGNGSNLMLPFSYGNHVLGIDYNSQLIQYANKNFEILHKNNTFEYNFYTDDMRNFVLEHYRLESDVLSLPNIINYIPKEDFLSFLKNLKKNKLYKKGALFFIRWRSPRDFRNGFGKRLNESCYQIDSYNNMTGESGALNYFYDEIEMVDILRNNLILENFKIFRVEFENLAVNGDRIFNSDIVLWGKIS